MTMTKTRPHSRRTGASPRKGGLGLILCAAAALALSLPVAGQIYKVTDENGNVVFTDRPATPDSTTQVEAVDLPSTNSAPSVTPRPAPAASTEPEAPAAPTLSVSIVSPTDETTIAMGPGNFNVSASTSPPLARNESLQLLIDGQPHGEPQRSPSWFVEGAIRGEHQLRVVRSSANGDRLAESDDVTIYVLRPSIAR